MPETMDTYIAGFPPEVQALLEQLRHTIRAAAPEASETISYGIATFKQAGTYVIYFAGWKKHLSVYPIPRGDPALEADLAPYREAKGTLRFPLDRPVPLDLVRRVVAARLAEIAAG
ncbi:MAG: hypothetical protein JWQ89_4071 [Devosia sp.]|uniref:iron chaperone n=1 Tax=Devosia sp. TaxID=1871048 RepID=UPI0026094584|nr:DUF1801 domain-containing protein [Devosia sp.]MDB5542344.1 hypothetical protein [Devosia sp.]